MKRIGRRLTQALLGVAAALALTSSCKPASSGWRPRPPQVACGESTPLLLNGAPSGLEQCSTRMIHRPRPIACPSRLPRADDGVAELERRRPELATQDRSQWPGNCYRDSDCKAAPNGYCQPVVPGRSTMCAYGCRIDTDCAKTELCRCGDPVGDCVPASCRSDLDCAGSLVCGDYGAAGGHCGSRDGFACQTADDECAELCRDVGHICHLVGDKRVCDDDFRCVVN